MHHCCLVLFDLAAAQLHCRQSCGRGLGVEFSIAYQLHAVIRRDIPPQQPIHTDLRSIHILLPRLALQLFPRPEGPSLPVQPRLEHGHQPCHESSSSSIPSSAQGQAAQLAKPCRRALHRYFDSNISPVIGGTSQLAGRAARARSRAGRRWAGIRGNRTFESIAKHSKPRLRILNWQQ